MVHTWGTGSLLELWGSVACLHPLVEHLEALAPPRAKAAGP